MKAQARSSGHEASASNARGLASKLLAGLLLQVVLMAGVFHFQKELKASAREQCNELTIPFNNNTNNEWPAGRLLGPELQQLALDAFPCTLVPSSGLHMVACLFKMQFLALRIILQGPWKHHDWAFCCLTIVSPSFAFMGVLLVAVHWVLNLVRRSRGKVRRITGAAPHNAGQGPPAGEPLTSVQGELNQHLQILVLLYAKVYFFMGPCLSFLNTCCRLSGGGTPGAQVHWQNSTPIGHILAIPLVMPIYKVSI